MFRFVPIKKRPLVLALKNFGLNAKKLFDTTTRKRFEHMFLVAHDYNHSQ